MKIAYLDASGGVAGDMFLGALIDAGLPMERLREALAALPLTGYAIRAEKSIRGGVSGTHVVVEVRSPQTLRKLGDLLALLDRSTLPVKTRERAAAAFRRLAEAEGAVHGVAPEEVHFHEVGAIDSIVDIAGSIAAVDLLGIERIFASAIALGRGRVQTSHGTMPVPAPATLLLAKGLEVSGFEDEGECTTPTGALLVSSLAERGAPPSFRLEAVGVGLGTRETPGRPNVFRVLLGEADAGTAGGMLRTHHVIVLETTLDDMTPELLAPLPERLIAAGALDVTLEPVLLKKGRPGHRIVVLSRPEKRSDLAAALFRETTTLGIRMRSEERFELLRGLVEVMTPDGPVRIKVAQLPGGERRGHPEYEDCRALADSTGRPLLEIVESARQSWIAAGRPLGREI